MRIISQGGTCNAKEVFEILRKTKQEMNMGLYDFTDHGKCTQCGECCSNLIPMTDKEVDTIRRHIKKHKIKEQKCLAPLTEPVMDMTCPFLDRNKKTERCTIYMARPGVCRFFKCDEPNGAIKHKELFDGVRRIVDLRETFFGKRF